jgi:hypothetical protein
MKTGLHLFLLATVLAAIGVLMVPGRTTAAIKSPPYADVFGNNWNDLNTYEAATDAFNNLNSAGYHAWNDKDSTAVTSMGSAYAQSDAVWADFGHGGPGYITFCNPPRGSSCTSVLRGDARVGRCSGGGDDCLSNYPTQIHYIRLMVFAGCHTAQNQTNTPNLVDYAVDTNHVDSAIGFRELIYFGGFTHPGETWSQSFFTYLRQGYTVSQAQSMAVNDVKNVFLALGNASGWDSAYIRNGSIKIVPAAYGS